MLRKIHYILDNLLKWAKNNNLWFNKPICKIQDIDFEKNTVIIQSKCFSVPIKFHFNEIISDVVIISNISSIQASWLGYYYGMYYQNQINKNIPIMYPSTYDLTLAESKRFKIQSQNRKGKITYLDTLDNTFHTQSIISIITNRSLIESFDPIEACYLGILGGVYLSKKNKKGEVRKFYEQTYLRLIK